MQAHMHHHMRWGRPSELATALAKQPHTTGEVLSSGVAPIPSVPGGGPALESATILPSGVDSPPDSLGLVPRARRLPEHGSHSSLLAADVGKARGVAMSLSAPTAERS